MLSALQVPVHLQERETKLQWVPFMYAGRPPAPICKRDARMMDSYGHDGLKARLTTQQFTFFNAREYYTCQDLEYSQCNYPGPRTWKCREHCYLQCEKPVNTVISLFLSIVKKANVHKYGGLQVLALCL